MNTVLLKHTEHHDDCKSLKKVREFGFKQKYLCFTLLFMVFKIYIPRIGDSVPSSSELEDDENIHASSTRERERNAKVEICTA